MNSKTAKAFLTLLCVVTTAQAQSTPGELTSTFRDRIRPFLTAYCTDCHGPDEPESDLDLSRFASLEDVARGHQIWDLLLERLAAGEMPPVDAARQPADDERDGVQKWFQQLRREEAERHAGDPGLVPVRRLSNAEYNYAIRDLTEFDLRPTETFPVDPANEAGFDNSADSLTMSPALLEKYLNAARQVVEHLVLKPDGFAFAPHPVVTDTDRDKYCVKQIVQFYERQPTDLADYFLAAWRVRVGDAELESLGTEERLSDAARSEGMSPKYLSTIWSVLNDSDPSVGPLAALRTMWQDLPTTASGIDAARSGSRAMRDYVVRVRQQLRPEFPNLYVEGNHRGSQTFVLWKNRQYAEHRRRFDPRVLENTESSESSSSDLVVPTEAEARADLEAALRKFCDVFPDAFYVSERGRDYLDKPRTEQESGRLLSAGFHSMMGYFRDDQPLYDLILDGADQAEIDSLWQELDFVTNAPARQYAGFLWFERTDSRFMRDAQFDFARPENKEALTQLMIERLAVLYLKKARDSGGDAVALKAIEDYFENINAQIRWVEEARRAAEPSHLKELLHFAARAYRRPLTENENAELLGFYAMLREQDQLGHEEALQDAIVSVLISPHFCYRIDLTAAGEEQRTLSDLELASRLSFFLWSTIPDEELVDLATRGELHRLHVLAGQVRRMLRDDRVRGLATEFGGNLLDFRRFDQHNSVDRERFPQFTSELRQSMFEEPIRLLVHLFQNEGSLLDLIDADYTFVNPILAGHYGIDAAAIEGDSWQQVSDASRYGRGGLLPMSVFLTANSPGLRTSPVKRGYWVVRRLLGEHIPPPPPNVPELPADESKLGDLTLPELLARHRDHASCAGCHERFDSIGLAFEGYGPIGERREVDLGGRPVVAAATFPDGRTRTGIGGLKEYLRVHRTEDFLENFSRKLLSYALGRTLQLSDELLLSEMRATLRTEDYRLGALVEQIVTSPQFLTKRGPAKLAGDGP